MVSTEPGMSLIPRTFTLENRLREQPELLWSLIRGMICGCPDSTFTVYRTLQCLLEYFSCMQGSGHSLSGPPSLASRLLHSPSHSCRGEKKP